jgi:hypothetical protein
MLKKILLGMLGTNDGTRLIRFILSNNISDLEVVGAEFRFTLPAKEDFPVIKEALSQLSTSNRTFPARLEGQYVFFNYYTVGNNPEKNNSRLLLTNHYLYNFSLFTEIIYKEHNYYLHVNDWSVFDIDDFIHPKGTQLYFKQQLKRASDPIINQLSPKGIALLFGLFSVKDKMSCQPLVATRYDDLAHIVNLLKNAKVCTQVPVVFQDIKNNEGNFNHKTVFCFYKSENTIHIIMMDSLYQEDLFLEKLKKIIGNDYEFKFYKPISKANENSIVRQKNAYTCGILAIKDATMFCSQPALANDIISNAKEGQEKDTYNYNPPVISYRSVEGTADVRCLQRCYGEKSIKTDRTLTQHYNKYRNTNYLDKFSTKYEGMVREFYLDNERNPEVIVSTVSRYDASQISSKQLEEIYSLSGRKIDGMKL